MISRTSTRKHVTLWGKVLWFSQKHIARKQQGWGADCSFWLWFPWLIRCSILPRALRQASIASLKYVRPLWIISSSCDVKRKRIYWYLLQTHYSLSTVSRCFAYVIWCSQPCDVVFIPFTYNQDALVWVPSPMSPAWPAESRTGFQIHFDVKDEAPVPTPESWTVPSEGARAYSLLTPLTHLFLMSCYFLMTWPVRWPHNLLTKQGDLWAWEWHP